MLVYGLEALGDTSELRRGAMLFDCVANFALCDHLLEFVLQLCDHS